MDSFFFFVLGSLTGTGICMASVHFFSRKKNTNKKVKFFVPSTSPPESKNKADEVIFVESVTPEDAFKKAKSIEDFITKLK